MRLKGKAVIVTGSTTGIGEAIARRVVEEGGSVLVTGRDERRGQRVVDGFGKRAVLHVDDLSDPASAKRIVGAANSAFGRIDAVVNNAALIPDGDLLAANVETFDVTFAVNVRTPMLIIQEALSALSASAGAVLNIGSVNAHCGEPGLLIYSMSKGALMAMSRNLGDGLHRDHGVRVNQINAGWVLTPNEHVRQIGRGRPDNWIDLISREEFATGRPLEPEVIAAAAVYWISDESKGVSGSVVELEQHPVIGRNYHGRQ